VESLIKSASTVSLQSLRTEIMKLSPQAANYLKDAFDFLESIIVVAETTEQLIKSRLAEVSQKAAPDRKGGKSGEVEITEAFADTLLTDINTATVLDEQALIVGYLAQQAVHYYPDKEATPFLGSLDRLLSGQELKLRVFAASALALSDTQIRSTETLTPILIAGLMGNEFSIRYYAHTSLSLLAKQDICYNPLDPPNDRDQAMVAWKEWWRKKQ